MIFWAAVFILSLLHGSLAIDCYECSNCEQSLQTRITCQNILHDHCLKFVGYDYVSCKYGCNLEIGIRHHNIIGLRFADGNITIVVEKLCSTATACDVYRNSTDFKTMFCETCTGTVCNGVGPSKLVFSLKIATVFFVLSIKMIEYNQD